MKLATYPQNNLLRNGFVFPPKLDKVWGTKHEYDLKSYFSDHIEVQIQHQIIGHWITPKIMSALSPRTKIVTNGS